ncbi:MAG: thiol:disulfide interchange protein DsbA/DsbL [Betaproteobacteria bacterium]
MKRRVFSAATSALIATGAWTSGVAQAQVKKLEEGTDYLALPKLVQVEAAKGKVEVIEFFWYNCPHCNAFEPALEAWVKRLPKDVAFKRIPVAFNDSLVPQQRLYYVLEALNKVDELHAKVFRAIHTEGLDLKTQDNMGSWLEKQGVDKAKFLNLYNSFSVSTKVRKASQMQDAYQVTGVPALGIAGRFYTDAPLAGNMAKALNVTDFLIAQVRSGH